MNLFRNTIVQLLIFLVSLGLCLSAAGTILDLWHRKDIVTTRQQDLNTITRENQKLKQELQDTKSTEYVERIARDKLGLVKDGESIILLPQNGQGAGGADTRSDTRTPNWLRWWNMFY